MPIWISLFTSLVLLALFFLYVYKRFGGGVFPLTFISYDIENSIMTVKDKNSKEWLFKGSGTVWYHWPSGERAGKLIGTETACIESALADIWAVHVRYRTS